VRALNVDPYVWPRNDGEVNVGAIGVRMVLGAGKLHLRAQHSLLL